MGRRAAAEWARAVLRRMDIDTVLRGTDDAVGMVYQENADRRGHAVHGTRKFIAKATRGRSVPGEVPTISGPQYISLVDDRKEILRCTPDCYHFVSPEICAKEGLFPWSEVKYGGKWAGCSLKIDWRPVRIGSHCSADSEELANNLRASVSLR